MCPSCVKPAKRLENVAHLVKRFLLAGETDEHAVSAMLVRPSGPGPAEVCELQQDRLS